MPEILSQLKWRFVIGGSLGWCVQELAILTSKTDTEFRSSKTFVEMDPGLYQ